MFRLLQQQTKLEVRGENRKSKQICQREFLNWKAGLTARLKSQTLNALSQNWKTERLAGRVLKTELPVSADTLTVMPVNY